MVGSKKDGLSFVEGETDGDGDDGKETLVLLLPSGIVILLPVDVPLYVKGTNVIKHSSF